MKKYIGVLFLFWAGALIVLYYVVQKPGLLNIFSGLLDTLWTILVAAILLFNAYGLGKAILRLTRFEDNPSTQHLIFSLGTGLGTLGLLGLFFSAGQLARKDLLTGFQFGLALFFLTRNVQKNLCEDLAFIKSGINISFSQYSLFTKIAISLLSLFAFLLTLSPPFEAFDALSYHLVQPMRILQDGGLQTINIPPFWYPNLTENVYLWTLAMGSDRAAQMMHFSWALLSIILLWHWATMTWNIEIGRKSLLLVASLASLPMLSSWAYADMALVFYSIAAIFALSQYGKGKTRSWLIVTGIMAGLAMTIKYTSFVVPLSCGLVLLFNRLSRQSMKDAIQFGCISLAVAIPWYIRNTIFMHNPFYPFLFKGLYWDTFRAEWYAATGTGIGWHALQILLIPLNMTLGYRDNAPADARIGSLFLIFLPLTVWIFIRDLTNKSNEAKSLKNIGIFVGISFAAWVYGVIHSALLWQIRFFYPALLMFAIPSAIGWNSLPAFDSPRLRISKMMGIIVNLVVIITVLDLGLFVFQRNPLSYAFGLQSRLQYMERVNPSYATLFKLIAQLPENAQVYNLFEPRTYALPRSTQPDIALDNFAHDEYLFQTPEEILQHWRAEHYTHILVNERGLDFMANSPNSKFTPAMQNTLQETLDQLQFVSQTPDKVYSIYKIP